MNFAFYPKHEYACTNLAHCPHLGGAAIGSVVSFANQNGDYLQMLQGQLEAERQSVARLLDENQELIAQIEQLKLELKVERQSKFATSASEEGEPDPPPPYDTTTNQPPNRRGAPLGHPGWFRPTPTEYDQLIPVEASACCPHCQGQVRTFPNIDPYDHLQEDIVDNLYQVLLYRHPAARCMACRRWVQQAGEGEILGSRIGPGLRSWAVYLRNGIGISYRKVPMALEELLGITFTPATLISFERVLETLGEPLVEDIAKKIASSDGPVHADETYWTVNTHRAFYWVHCTESYVHFQFDMSRAGEVSRNLLGPYFDGTLVTDCYAGYEAHTAKAKQKCLAHLARTARDWQKVVPTDSAGAVFFADVREFVRRGCRFYRERAAGGMSAAELAVEANWLREELRRLQACPLDTEKDAKAVTLQSRIIKHADQWLVFLEDPRVGPTNNRAERDLRPLVVLRKITFGHRTAAGATRMGKLMTVGETAKRHGHRPTRIFYRMYTRPPNEVLEHLYAGGSRT